MHVYMFNIQLIVLACSDAVSSCWSCQLHVGLRSELEINLVYEYLIEYYVHTALLFSAPMPKCFSSSVITAFS